jgi:hypothetical protein
MILHHKRSDTDHASHALNASRPPRGGFFFVLRPHHRSGRP